MMTKERSQTREISKINDVRLKFFNIKKLYSYKDNLAVKFYSSLSAINF